MNAHPFRTAVSVPASLRADRFVPWRQDMDVAAVLAALEVTPSAEPAVLLRLLVMAIEAETAEQRLVGSFVRPLSMPLALARPDVEIVVDIRGRRRVFKPASILWDETHRACVLEVVWIVGDGSTPDATADDEPWAL